MRHLILISFFLLPFAFSCKVQNRISRSELPTPFILSTDKNLVYRASFDYKEHHFSGLCVLKKTNEQNIRIVFLSEMGITLMDFELRDEDMLVHKIIEQLNRKILLTFLENDFRQLLMTDLFDPERVRIRKKDRMEEFRVKNNLKASYYRRDIDIEKSVRKGLLGFKKASVNYEYGETHIPTRIILTHHRVKMNLKLTLLEKI